MGLSFEGTYSWGVADFKTLLMPDSRSRATEGTRANYHERWSGGD